MLFVFKYLSLVLPTKQPNLPMNFKNLTYPIFCFEAFCRDFAFCLNNYERGTKMFFETTAQKQIQAAARLYFA